MNQNLEKPATKDELHKELGDFADEVILPGVQGIVDDSEKRIGEKIDYLDRKIDGNSNGINTVLEQLQRIQETLDLMGAEQSKNKLEVKVIDWLCKRVDVLERKLGVAPVPIGRE